MEKALEDMERRVRGGGDWQGMRLQGNGVQRLAMRNGGDGLRRKGNWRV